MKPIGVPTGRAPSMPEQLAKNIKLAEKQIGKDVINEQRVKSDVLNAFQKLKSIKNEQLKRSEIQKFNRKLKRILVQFKKLNKINELQLKEIHDNLYKDIKIILFKTRIAGLGKDKYKRLTIKNVTKGDERTEILIEKDKDGKIVEIEEKIYRKEVLVLIHGYKNGKDRLTEYDYKKGIINIFVDGKLKYKTLFDNKFNKKYTKLSPLKMKARLRLDEKGKPLVGTYNYEKNEYEKKNPGRKFNTDLYLTQLALKLDTPRKLADFMDFYFMYTDDVRTGTKKGEYWQDYKETMKRLKNCYMLGDCEDYSFFAQAVLKRREKLRSEGKLGLNAKKRGPEIYPVVIAIPQHAICVWVVKKNNRFHAYSIGTFGLDINGNQYGKKDDPKKKKGYATPVAALNSLMLKYRHAGLGLAKGVHYKINPHKIEIVRSPKNGKGESVHVPVSYFVDKKNRKSILRKARIEKENERQADVIAGHSGLIYLDDVIKRVSEKIRKTSDYDSTKQQDRVMTGSYDKYKNPREAIIKSYSKQTEFKLIVEGNNVLYAIAGLEQLKTTNLENIVRLANFINFIKKTFGNKTVESGKKKEPFYWNKNKLEFALGQFPWKNPTVVTGFKTWRLLGAKNWDQVEVIRAYMNKNYRS